MASSNWKDKLALVKENTKPKMKRLNCKVLPDNSKMDNISEHYINIPGTVLDAEHNSLFTTISGKVINVNRAFDYVLHKGYPKEFLTKEVLSKADNIKISKLAKTDPVNKWAILAIIIADKIASDEEAMELVLDGRDFMAVRLNETPLVTTVTPIKAHKMTIGILREVANFYRSVKEDGLTGEDVKSRLLEMVQPLKRDPTASVFNGTSIIAPYM